MTPPAPPVVPAVAWLGTWSKPHDRPSQVALGLAAALLMVALAPGGPKWLASLVEFASLVDLRKRRRFLTVSAFIAAFLSLGYIAFYLRGGPRAPEAATYWLQGRAMAHGTLGWSVLEPSASFRATDLLFSLPDRLTGIFPPGYPLLLAPAFLVGAPMVVGPLLAAALVFATWLLAGELARADDLSEERSEIIARVAAGLSILSAALRYHTADVLPFGAAAFAVAMALGSAMRARRTLQPRLFGVAGLSLGFLVATQLESALIAATIVAALAWGARERGRALRWAIVAVLPGVLLLAAANHAAIGKAFASPVTAYLNAFDSRVPLDKRGALMAALRRLRAHLLDIDNFEPIALLAILAIARGGRGARLGALVVAGQILLARPFDAGTISPGAGAKLLVPVLPIEHALVALGLARLFPNQTPRAALATFVLALAGFAIHASAEHLRVASADLGRPRFEPDLVREANVTSGLLFFDNDSGFKLAFDPRVPASHGIQAARMRNDDHDRLLYDLLGHPPSHRYVASATSASVTAWSPPVGSGDTWRFEAESDWPPASSWGGRSEVVDASTSCVSEGHVLALTPNGTLKDAPDAGVRIALPVPRGSTPSTRKIWHITPRVLERGTGGSGTLVLVTSVGGPPVAEWHWDDTSKKASCVDLPPQPVELGGDLPRAWLELRARGGAVALDKTTLRAR